MSLTGKFPPALIPALTPVLVAGLRWRTQAVLSYLVETNSISTYFNESELLADFREAVRQNAERTVLFQSFHDHVPLSAYENYAPFVSRFFESPCRLLRIKDLMSPGYPEFIAHSSGTSSGATKHFPKYRHPEHMSTSTSETVAASMKTSESGGKNCIVCSLRYRQVIEGVNEYGDVDLKMLVCLMSTGTVRAFNHLHVDEDPSLQAQKLSNQSSPLGVSFISNYTSFLFMHALFALYEPQVELINTMFATIFRDFARVIDEQWDTLLECIETGTIPDLASVGHLKDALQASDMKPFLPPNPARATQLREIDLSSPGSFTKIWPGLRVVIAISSGPFQTVVPEIRKYIGSSVELHTLGINCSEAFLALAYDQRDPSLYKVVGSDDIIEFLSVQDPEESKYVRQSWNVDVGERYEVVLTTRDGLWRYRLGDVVEVVGFDPRDGQPVVRYSERRGVHIRLANEIVTGQELLNAIQSISDPTGVVVSEFCVCPDYRESVPRYCFFVEVRDGLDSLSTSASQHLDEHLGRHNENYLRETQAGKLGRPTVRVLKPGTFGEYRDWKVHSSGMASGQIKVPLVVWDEDTRNWLGAHVIQDL